MSVSSNAATAAVAPQQNHPMVSVLIVGAGAASMKLAHTLWQQGGSSDGEIPPFHITIVEANDYVGGRVKNGIFEGHTVELGANWVSGRSDAFENPIWKLAEAIDLRGRTSDRESSERVHAVYSNCGRGASVGDSDGEDDDGVVTEEYVKQAARFDEIYTLAVEHAVAEIVTGKLSAANDVSVRSLLELFGWPAKDDLSDVERAVEEEGLEVWAVDRLEDLGAVHDMKPGANDVDLSKDEMFVEDARGFNAIFQGMVQDLLRKDTGATAEGGGGTTITDMLLEHEVQSICYSPGNVMVVAKDLKSGEIKEIRADMVVSTVSLGVLQSGSIQFSPPLPDWKVQALNEIKMFNFAKVFVKLPKTLWPTHKDFLVLVTRGEENRGYYSFWIRYKNVDRKGKDDDTDSDLMLCYVGGAQARRVELLTEEELKGELEELFFKAFARGRHSQVSRHHCRPVSVKVTDWSLNPRFCGSYSYFPKGAFGTVPIADLGRSLTGMDTKVRQPTNEDPALSGLILENPALPSTLYFAGEAFDDNFNGWIQGGYLSGERVANSIIEACKATTKSSKVT